MLNESYYLDLSFPREAALCMFSVLWSSVGSSGELQRTIGLLCTPSSDEAFSFTLLFVPNNTGTEKSSDLENIGISFYCKIFTISSFS